MKLNLLIISEDLEYVDHLSKVIQELYLQSFDLTICTSEESLKNFIDNKKFDVLLFEEKYFDYINNKMSKMSIMLTEDNSKNEYPVTINKYQRISKIVSGIYEAIANENIEFSLEESDKTVITAVWSPSGGVGKTTIALAYAANKINNGKKVLYINLENFSSVPAYFDEDDKSVSLIFEKIDSNISLLSKGLRQTDDVTGISYFSSPNNYDDINILDVEDIETFIKGCMVDIDELVIDFSSQCDKKTIALFELSNRILLVNSYTETNKVKMRQFLKQHNVFNMIKNKCILVNNKGDMTTNDEINKVIYLPLIKNKSEHQIIKNLSSNDFNW